MSKDDRQMISQEGEKQMKKIEVFIQSMTPEEREHPELMNSSRKKRISQGSGIPLHDINIYINQFEQMRKMMKGMSDMKNMFKGMGNKLGQQGAGMLAMKEMRKNMRRFK
jgi:signal recognition particle subunit SRP54